MAVASEAPKNEFVILSHPRPWWEALLPFAFLGLWFAFCGLTTWFVAGSLINRLNTIWPTFIVAALLPLLSFTLFYFAVSIASGANSIHEVVVGFTRMKLAVYIVLGFSISVGIGAAFLRVRRHQKSISKRGQVSLDAFK